MQQYWYHLQSTCETFLLLPNSSLTAGNHTSSHVLELHQEQLHFCRVFVLCLNLFKFKSPWENEASIYPLEEICVLPLVA